MLTPQQRAHLLWEVDCMASSCVSDTSPFHLRDLTIGPGKGCPLCNRHRSVCRCFLLCTRSRCLVWQDIWQLDIYLDASTGKIWSINYTNKICHLKIWVSHEMRAFVLQHQERVNLIESLWLVLNGRLQAECLVYLWCIFMRYVTI